MLNKLNMNDDAKKEFKIAIKYNPNYSEAYNNLGVLLMNEGRHQDAIEMLRKAILHNPEYANAYRNPGKAYETNNNDDLAKEVYRKAQELINL